MVICARAIAIGNKCQLHHPSGRLLDFSASKVSLIELNKVICSFPPSGAVNETDNDGVESWEDHGLIDGANQNH
jgi:hypothetical protein